MSRSCQSATFSRAATALPRSTRARPVRRSQVIGLRLCGMALEPFWPFVNGSSASRTSVRCKCRNSTAQRSMLAPTSASVFMKFGVNVALDNLRGDRRGSQAEFFADKFLHARRQMRARANRAGKFSDGDNFARAFEPFQRAAKFIVHQRHFQAKRRRLAVNAVAAADAGREFVFLRARGDDGQKFFDIGDQDVRALRHLHGEAGVADVAARQAEMQPAAGAVVDFFGDGGGEADDVVVERFLQFLLPLDEAISNRQNIFRRRVLIFAKSFFGTTPSATSASLASNSICSQMRSLFSSVQIARISGRE